MMQRLAAAVALAATVLIAAAILSPEASAYPKPSIVQRDWQFDFTFATPKPIAVRDINGSIQWYWYMTYKVINNTGQERQLVPEITLATDAGDILDAGRRVPSTVFDAIQEKVGNPLLESPIEVIGKILQGEDFARESVAIWPAPLHPVNEMRIFVSGLSGESARIENPLTGDPVLMRKTLMIHFTTPGNPRTPQEQPVLLQDQEWIMR